jgi:Ricin-type beta-trefoil lectin domain
MLSQRKILGLFSVAAAIAVSLVFAPAAHAAGPFQIKVFGSQKCIQIPAIGDQLEQQPCDRANRAQLWLLDPIGGNDYHIINVASGMCMRARGQNADFTPVETTDCTNISDERFTFDAPVPNPVPHEIHSRLSGGNRCLDIANTSNANGAKLQLFHCTGNNPGQVFMIG